MRCAADKFWLETGEHDLQLRTPEGDAKMFRRRPSQSKTAARYQRRDAGNDLALAVTLVVFGILPIGVVSAMMLTQIFGG
ncbi:MAG TPA: hypothetical protein VKT24_06080 [Rhizomicrobium sp.]|nr:hypothetical protein [Rhizomicrobium sp.]